MMHSIYLSNAESYISGVSSFINTYDKWRIVPTSRPVINPPAYKKKILDIPGASGSLDISEALTGFPVFENRTGSWEFVVLNEWDGVDNYQWARIYESIMSFVHGKKMIIILEDDPEYWYTGRLTVNNWNSGKDHSNITIDYDLQPYKFSLLSSTEAVWLWDDFYFGDPDNGDTHIDGDEIVPAKFSNIAVNQSGVVVDAQAKLFGNAPFCPEFVVSGSSGMDVSIMYFDHLTGGNITVTRHIVNGNNKIYEITLYNTDAKFTFTGDGSVSILFNRGYL